MSTVLLCTLGSAGDVHPVMAVALALQRQGHRPILITSEVFGPSCEALGIEFEPLHTGGAFEQAKQHPDVWHPWRGFGVLAREVILPAMRPLYERIEHWHRNTDDLVVAASLLCVGARIARETLDVPLVSMHVQPVVLRSFRDDLHTPHLSYPRRGPKLGRAIAYSLADRFVIDRELRRGLDPFRARLGLAPVGRVLRHWIHSPDLVVGLWPSWYAPLQPDWPDNVVLTDFPLFDPGQDDALPPRVARFLEAGEAPVVFTGGSGNVHTTDFFAMAARVCARLRIRGLLVGPQEPPAHVLQGDHVMYTEFIPFGTLLPRCRAIVHHGGIGTTARAMYNGLPQVVLPHSHDQPDNAVRVRHLGLGDFIAASSVTDDALTRVLGAQLERGRLNPPPRSVGARSGPDAAAMAITRIARPARA